MQSLDISEIRKAYNATSTRKSDKYGINLYKDEEILLLGKNDVADRWGILLHDGRLNMFHGSVAWDMSQTSDVFSGYLLTVPPKEWQAMDVYGLSNRIESSSFSLSLEIIGDKAYTISLMMDLVDNVISSSTGNDSDTELMYICRAMMATISGFCNFKTVISSGCAQNRITDRFLQLVDKNCLKERTLSFYAEKLDISPKYLSAVVSQASGKKAGQWISENAVDKMKVLLTTTSFSMEELSKLTGFIDSSSFCRYFRKYTGISPMRYKRNTLREMAQSGSPSLPRYDSLMTGWPYAENDIDNKRPDSSFIRGI